MNSYTFALSYYDDATGRAHIKVVDVVAESRQHASEKIENCIENKEWLMAVFDAVEDFGLDGIVVGDAELMLRPPDDLR